MCEKRGDTSLLNHLFSPYLLLEALGPLISNPVTGITTSLHNIMTSTMQNGSNQRAACICITCTHKNMLYVQKKIRKLIHIMYAHTCNRACTGTNMLYIYIYIHILIYLFIYMYIYIYMHAPKPRLTCSSASAKNICTYVYV